jgi:hypothetical protein
MVKRKKKSELAGLKRVEISRYSLRAEAYPAFLTRIIHNTSALIRTVELG